MSAPPPSQQNEAVRTVPNGFEKIGTIRVFSRMSLIAYFIGVADSLKSIASHTWKVQGNSDLASTLANGTLGGMDPLFQALLCFFGIIGVKVYLLGEAIENPIVKDGRIVHWVNALPSKAHKFWDVLLRWIWIITLLLLPLTPNIYSNVFSVVSPESIESRKSIILAFVGTFIAHQVACTVWELFLFERWGAHISSKVLIETSNFGKYGGVVTIVLCILFVVVYRYLDLSYSFLNVLGPFCVGSGVVVLSSLYYANKKKTRGMWLLSTLLLVFWIWGVISMTGILEQLRSAKQQNIEVKITAPKNK
jgi:hypothetical protein